MATTAAQEAADQSCPICLLDKPQASLALAGSCGHSFCTDCLSQYYSLPSATTTTTTPETAEEDYYALRVQDLQDCNIDGVATLKGCPLCRCPISLLELKDAKSLQPVWGCHRNLDLESSPLAGKIYATRRGLGYNSFHFPPHHEEAEGDDEDYATANKNLPYFLWEEDNALLDAANEGEREECLATKGTKYYFQPGCFYFAPKRSFHGQLLLPGAHGTLERHDVLLDFAANHRWITGGLLFRRPSPGRPTDTHPLEGTWEVTWYNEALPSDANLEDQPDSVVLSTAHVNVVDNCILDEQNMVYRLRFEEDRICFQWPGFGVTQTLEPDSDFRSTNTIPQEGATLRWNTNDSNQPFIVWKRESMGDPDASIKPNITYFGRSGDRNNSNNGDILAFQRNTSQTWYREWRPTSNNHNLNSPSSSGENSAVQNHPGRPPYYSSQLWGNSFCQGLRVGLASYHFGIQPSATEGEEGTPFAYISYENDMCSQWPPLDDGSPIPPQVRFQNISLERADAEDPAQDTSHYVFRGNIEWLEDYGTTWQNNQRWEYEMHFDSTFTCIVSGTVHCVVASNDDNEDSSTQRQEMSQFGTDLVYVNAGIVNAFEDMMNDDTLFPEILNSRSDEPPPVDTDTPAEMFPRYTHISRAMRRRLQAEGASVRTVAMLNMIFTHSLQPGGDSPIDYNT